MTAVSSSATSRLLALEEFPLQRVEITGPASPCAMACIYALAARP
jgi:hypothetical protein